MIFNGNLCLLVRFYSIDTKYIRNETLKELRNALIAVATQAEQSDNSPYVSVFFLELMISIALENKDRLAPHWIMIMNFLSQRMRHESEFVVERAAMGLLRLVSRLLSREELTDQLMNGLQVLLKLPESSLRKLSAQLAYGLFHLIRTNAANTVEISKKDPKIQKNQFFSEKKPFKQKFQWRNQTFRKRERG